MERTKKEKEIERVRLNNKLNQRNGKRDRETGNPMRWTDIRKEKEKSTATASCSERITCQVIRCEEAMKKKKKRTSVFLSHYLKDEISFNLVDASRNPAGLPIFSKDRCGIETEEGKEDNN